MNIRTFYILLLVLFAFNLQAQTIRTDVIVAGGNGGGIGAGIQAAHSGVKALIVEESNVLGQGLTQPDTTKRIGLIGDLISLSKPGADLGSTLKGWTDTVKNLQVITGAKVERIKKAGKGWKIRLSNGRKVKASVIVDATQGNSLAQRAGSKGNASVTAISREKVTLNELYNTLNYRTHVATDVSNTGNLASSPLGNFIAADIENLILLPKTTNTSGSLLEGQAAGGSAAFCAFFKTTTKNLNIRMVQGELLNFKSELIHFDDIPLTDTNYSALQHLAATGIIKGKISGNQLLFLPDQEVTFEEIRLPMREYYTRSQIWFADHQTGTLTINDVLSLIKFSGSRGEELNRQVEKAWGSAFGFKSPLDLKRAVTRREFAVLIDTYLKPFNVRVDFTGKLLY